MHKIFVLQAIMASQSLTEILKSISKDWINYRKASESLSKTGAKIRTVNKNHYMYDLIIHDWSNKISERFTNKVEIHSYEPNKIKILIYSYPKEIIIDQLIFDSVEKKFFTSDLKKLIKFVIKFKPKKFPLSGKDVIDKGFSEGKTIGIVLQKIK